MHFNSGYRPECVPLVKRFAEVFAGYDAVVTPSASCAAMVRHYHHVVDPAVTVPKVHELCEFLVDVLGVTDVGASFPYTVAFHATCHSQRLLHLGDRPQRLLAAVDGLRLRPLTHPAECCGFGGTFSVKNPDTSTAMGEDKVADVRSTGAEVLTSADTSCLMHLGGLLSRQGAPVRVMHVAEILAATEQPAAT
jgi:L-lactate dehydrogenase complex protein LldE